MLPEVMEFAFGRKLYDISCNWVGFGSAFGVHVDLCS